MSLSGSKKAKIREAFNEGTLKVQSVDPETGKTEKREISNIFQHDTPNKPIKKIETSTGKVCKCTGDHSLFQFKQGELEPAEADNLEIGNKIVVTEGKGKSKSETIVKIENLDPENHTYDLSVPSYENFVTEQGIVAHNSYDIGGISLDLQKASEYESRMNSAEDRFQKMLEAKERTVKVTRGLKQSRYGIGVRSAFGPHTHDGSMTPRKFLGF